MDSQKLFAYGLPGTGLSYASPHSSFHTIHNVLFSPFKFDIWSPLDSSFSNLNEAEALGTLSSSQEQHSSPGNNLSALSPASDHSLETSSGNFYRPSNLPLENYIRNPPSITSLSLEGHHSQRLKYRLQELENALMDTDDDEGTASNALANMESFPMYRFIQPQGCSSHKRPNEDGQIEKHHKAMRGFTIEDPKPSDLKQLIIACAKSLNDKDMDRFEYLVEHARVAVSKIGEPMERVGAYLIDGLVARRESSGSNIYKAFDRNETESKDSLPFAHILYEICPYLKFGYMAVNGAIAEACKSEDFIHIIDFQIAQGSQWITLLQALSARPGRAPHVRITGIYDPVSKFAQGVGPEEVARRLYAISEECKIPLVFRGIPVFSLHVTREMLDIRHEEALAVNFPMQLHHTPDEGVDVNNPRDGLLRLVKSLSPKVTTLVEQESNTNTTPFLTRFMETLEYYLAMFESIDASLPRESKERIDVEQHCLARDMVNIIACEGKERVERHELLGKWKSRLTMAGFKQYPLSSYVNSVISSLLKWHSDHYTAEEIDGAMLLGWKDRKLISASAWH